MEHSLIKNQPETDPNENPDLLDPLDEAIITPDEPQSPTPILLDFASVSLPDICARVPRPTNAFMIYANENRKVMAKQFPMDSNKEISKRLGHCWKDLEPERRAVYYTLAKQVDADHKKKYPSMCLYLPINCRPIEFER